MPLTVPRMTLLIVHSYLLTVAGALPVTETTTSRETDIKQTGVPIAEANTLRVDSEDPPPFSTGQSDLFQTPNLPIKPDKNEADGDDEDGDEPATIMESEAQFHPCKVGNITYQHKEQIPRSDPCEMCVCVDSEMYCFWKLCGILKSTSSLSSPPPTLETRFHMEKNVSDVDQNERKEFILRRLDDEKEKSNEIVATNEKYSKIITDQRKYNILKKLETTSTTISTANETSTAQSSTTVPTSTMEPVVCYVMGVIYKYGEILPKDTGTCLECACSDGGRVTCSPKDCVSQPDLDYLSHNNNMDLFDIDTF